MAFFSEEKLRPRRIEIDPSTSTCDSPDIRRRLDRIARNYEQLDQVLVDIEFKLSQDARLAALDQDDVDFESEFGIKPKQKWRPKKPKRQPKKSPTHSRTTPSSNPRKPR